MSGRASRNEHAKKYIAENGGKVVNEEYVPFGAPNKFEEAVTRIKSAKPDAVLITLVGADNVNFNRTFAGFGLDKEIARLSLLLEENTLKGIGAESSNNLFSCMSYYANAPGDANKKFKAAYFAKFGDKAPQLSIIGTDCYAGINCAQGAGRQGAAAPMRARSDGRLERPDLRQRRRTAGRCTANMSTRPCILPPARAPSSRSSRPSKRVKQRRGLQGV